MDRLVRDSYAGKFPTSDLTPLTPVADKYVLELYHGPTSAFITAVDHVQYFSAVLRPPVLRVHRPVHQWHGQRRGRCLR